MDEYDPESPTEDRENGGVVQTQTVVPTIGDKPPLNDVPITDRWTTLETSVLDEGGYKKPKKKKKKKKRGASMEDGEGFDEEQDVPFQTESTEIPDIRDIAVQPVPPGITQAPDFHDDGDRPPRDRREFHGRRSFGSRHSFDEFDDDGRDFDRRGGRRGRGRFDDRRDDRQFGRRRGRRGFDSPDFNRNYDDYDEFEENGDFDGEFNGPGPGFDGPGFDGPGYDGFNGPPGMNGPPFDGQGFPPGFNGQMPFQPGFQQFAQQMNYMPGFNGQQPPIDPNTGMPQQFPPNFPQGMPGMPMPPGPPGQPGMPNQPGIPPMPGMPVQGGPNPPMDPNQFMQAYIQHQTMLQQQQVQQPQPFQPQIQGAPQLIPNPADPALAQIQLPPPPPDTAAPSVVEPTSGKKKKKSKKKSKTPEIPPPAPAVAPPPRIPTPPLPKMGTGDEPIEIDDSPPHVVVIDEPDEDIVEEEEPIPTREEDESEQSAARKLLNKVMKLTKSGEKPLRDLNQLPPMIGKGLLSLRQKAAAAPVLAPKISFSVKTTSKTVDGSGGESDEEDQSKKEIMKDRPKIQKKPDMFKPDDDKSDPTIQHLIRVRNDLELQDKIQKEEFKTILATLNQQAPIVPKEPVKESKRSEDRKSKRGSRWSESDQNNSHELPEKDELIGKWADEYQDRVEVEKKPEEKEEEDRKSPDDVLKRIAEERKRIEEEIYDSPEEPKSEEKKREKSPEKRHDKSQEKHKDKSPERKRASSPDRPSERSRDKYKDSKRDNSRDSRERSKGKSREKSKSRSQSRSRERSRERGRKYRNKNKKSRKSSSRSKSRSKSKSKSRSRSKSSSKSRSRSRTDSEERDKFKTRKTKKGYFYEDDRGYYYSAKNTPWYKLRTEGGGWKHHPGYFYKTDYKVTDSDPRDSHPPPPRFNPRYQQRRHSRSTSRSKSDRRRHDRRERSESESPVREKKKKKRDHSSQSRSSSAASSDEDKKKSKGKSKKVSKKRRSDSESSNSESNSEKEDKKKKSKKKKKASKKNASDESSESSRESAASSDEGKKKKSKSKEDSSKKAKKVDSDEESGKKKSIRRHDTTSDDDSEDGKKKRKHGRQSTPKKERRRKKSETSTSDEHSDEKSSGRRSTRDRTSPQKREESQKKEKSSDHSRRKHSSSERKDEMEFMETDEPEGASYKSSKKNHDKAPKFEMMVSKLVESETHGGGDAGDESEEDDSSDSDSSDSEDDDKKNYSKKARKKHKKGRSSIDKVDYEEGDSKHKKKSHSKSKDQDLIKDSKKLSPDVKSSKKKDGKHQNLEKEPKSKDSDHTKKRRSSYEAEDKEKAFRNESKRERKGSVSKTKESSSSKKSKNKESKEVEAYDPEELYDPADLFSSEEDLQDSKSGKSTNIALEKKDSKPVKASSTPTDKSSGSKHSKTASSPSDKSSKHSKTLSPTSEKGRSSKHSKTLSPTSEKGSSSKHSKTLSPTSEKGSSSKHSKTLSPTSEKGSSSKHSKTLSPTSEKGSSSKHSKTLSPTSEKGSSFKHSKTLSPTSEKGSSSKHSKTTTQDQEKNSKSKKQQVESDKVSFKILTKTLSKKQKSTFEEEFMDSDENEDEISQRDDTSELQKTSVESKTGPKSKKDKSDSNEKLKFESQDEEMKDVSDRKKSKKKSKEEVVLEYPDSSFDMFSGDQTKKPSKTLDAEVQPEKHQSKRHLKHDRPEKSEEVPVKNRDESKERRKTSESVSPSEKSKLEKTAADKDKDSKNSSLVAYDDDEDLDNDEETDHKKSSKSKKKHKKHKSRKSYSDDEEIVERKHHHKQKVYDDSEDNDHSFEKSESKKKHKKHKKHEHEKDSSRKKRYYDDGDEISDDDLEVTFKTKNESRHKLSEEDDHHSKHSSKDKLSPKDKKDKESPREKSSFKEKGSPMEKSGFKDKESPREKSSFKEKGSPREKSKDKESRMDETISKEKESPREKSGLKAKESPKEKTRPEDSNSKKNDDTPKPLSTRRHSDENPRKEFLSESKQRSFQEKDEFVKDDNRRGSCESPRSDLQMSSEKQKMSESRRDREDYYKKDSNIPFESHYGKKLDEVSDRRSSGEYSKKDLEMSSESRGNREGRYRKDSETHLERDDRKHRGFDDREEFDRGGERRRSSDEFSRKDFTPLKRADMDMKDAAYGSNRTGRRQSLDEYDPENDIPPPPPKRRMHPEEHYEREQAYYENEAYDRPSRQRRGSIENRRSRTDERHYEEYDPVPSRSQYEPYDPEFEEFEHIYDDSADEPRSRDDYRPRDRPRRSDQADFSRRERYPEDYERERPKERAFSPRSRREIEHTRHENISSRRYPGSSVRDDHYRKDDTWRQDESSRFHGEHGRRGDDQRFKSENRHEDTRKMKEMTADQSRYPDPHFRSDVEYSRHTDRKSKQDGGSHVTEFDIGKINPEDIPLPSDPHKSAAEAEIDYYTGKKQKPSAQDSKPDLDKSFETKEKKKGVSIVDTLLSIQKVGTKTEHKIDILEREAAQAKKRRRFTDTPQVFEPRNTQVGAVSMSQPSISATLNSSLTNLQSHDGTSESDRESTFNQSGKFVHRKDFKDVGASTPATTVTDRSDYESCYDEVTSSDTDIKRHYQHHPTSLPVTIPLPKDIYGSEIFSSPNKTDGDTPLEDEVMNVFDMSDIPLPETENVPPPPPPAKPAQDKPLNKAASLRRSSRLSARNSVDSEDNSDQPETIQSPVIEDNRSKITMKLTSKWEKVKVDKADVFGADTEETKSKLKKHVFDDATAALETPETTKDSPPKRRSSRRSAQAANEALVNLNNNSSRRGRGKKNPGIDTLSKEVIGSETSPVLSSEDLVVKAPTLPLESAGSTIPVLGSHPPLQPVSEVISKHNKVFDAFAVGVPEKAIDEIPVEPGSIIDQVEQEITQKILREETERRRPKSDSYDRDDDRHDRRDRRDDRRDTRKGRYYDDDRDRYSRRHDERSYDRDRDYEDRRYRDRGRRDRDDYYRDRRYDDRDDRDYDRRSRRRYDRESSYDSRSRSPDYHRRPAKEETKVEPENIPTFDPPKKVIPQDIFTVAAPPTVVVPVVAEIPPAKFPEPQVINTNITIVPTQAADSSTSPAKPLKVKSRWLRFSEAEASQDNVVPSADDPSLITTPAQSGRFTSNLVSIVPVETLPTSSAPEEAPKGPVPSTYRPPPPDKPVDPQIPAYIDQLVTDAVMTPAQHANIFEILNQVKVPELKAVVSSTAEATEVPDIEADEKLVAPPELQEPVKIPYFEPIDENLYLTERRQSKEMRRMACDCTTSKEDREMGIEACGNDCLNRMLYIECGSRCACLDYCTNKRFQKRQYSNVEAFQTPWKGFGLRAVEELKTDDFVLEYVGEVLDFRGFKNRSRQYAKENQTHFYFMALNPDVMIDATVKGNISRFINHSCDPNCETQKWTVNGELRIGFFTKRTIPPGEELTFNYQFETYGQKAQKCFCGSENCRGTIGIEKPARFKSNKKKDRTKKKEEMIGVDEIEEQIERMNVEGLTNKNHVLNLCRLMVYVQQTDHRVAILKILQNTPEPACLRLFVEYHGLPLLWSWMADLNQEPSSEFQYQVLSLLSELPITNRTILQDSKILSIIEKWTETSEAESYTELPPPPPGMTPVGILACPKDTKEAKDKNPKKRVTFAEEEPSSDSEMSDVNCTMAEASSTISISAEGVEVSGTDTVTDSVTDSATDTVTHDTETSSEDKESVQEVEQSNQVESSEDTGDVPQQEADSSNDTREKKEGEYLIEGSATEEESQDDESSSDSQDAPSISSVASKLLEHWSNLKEVFKIPRKERVEERKRTEQELDTRYEENRDSLYADWNTKRRKKGKKRGAEEESFIDHNRPRRTLLPTPPKMSKEERRQLFEAQVKAKDEMNAEFQRQQMETLKATYPLVPVEYFNDPGFITAVASNPVFALQLQDPNFILKLQDPNFMMQFQELNNPEQDPNLTDLSEQDMVMFDQNILLQMQQDPNLVLQLMQQDPNLMLQLQQDPTLVLQIQQNPGLLLQLQQLSNMALQMTHDPNMVVPGLTGLPSQVVDVNGQLISTGMPPQPEVTQQQQQIMVDSNGQQIVFTQPYQAPIQQIQPPQQFFPVQQQQQHQQQASTVVQQTPPPVHTLQQLSDANLVQQQLQQLITLHQNLAASTPSSSQILEDDIPPPPSPPKAKQPKLPPNWKTAKDADGKTYFYHSITRITQWDPPTWDQTDIVADMDLGTPTFDEFGKKKKKTKTAEADTSSEVEKKLKDIFRKGMSTYIVSCLNPYRKNECKLGKITSTDDFKHLARKLTHHVMAKELKHCRHVEDLEVNENVKSKAKDYVRKYMSKSGTVYKKPLDDDIY